MTKLTSIITSGFSKLKSKIKGLLSPRIIKVKLKYFDAREFYLYNPPYHLETEIYWKGFENFNWELQTRLIWAKLCTKSNTIFDIGANSGIFSLLAKACNEKSSVYAFEPQTNIYQVLQKNNDINSFDISCQQIALSDINGTLPFYNYGNDTFGKNNTTAGSLNKSWRKQDQKSIDVPVSTLDSFILDHQIDKIDLIKIDVESYEPEVLEGYKQHLDIHRPVIIIEIIGSEIGQRINSYFEGKSYDYFNIHESDGLIRTDELGIHEYRNYLLCPNEKLEQISNLN